MPDQTNEDGVRPTCFIAMPITTHEHEAEKYADPEHWEHVLQALFVPAIEQAGFEPVIPIAKGSHLIHDVIIRQLSECDMVLCDLSGHNPNVFFELGVRTSLNLPIALIHDGEAKLPFDTSGINTPSYRPTLHGWHLEEERALLAQHLRDARDSCDGQNPMWRRFGLQITAAQPRSTETPLEAKIDLLAAAVDDLQARRPTNAGRRLYLAESGWDEALVVQDTDASRMSDLLRQVQLAAQNFKLDLRYEFRDDQKRLNVYGGGQLPSTARQALVESATRRGIEIQFLDFH